MKVRNIDDSIVAVLDLGSEKIRVAIAEIDENKNIAIIGKGEADSKGGIRSGVIINIEAVVGSIVEAVEKAEMQAGREISGLFVAVSGGSVESYNSKGVVAISGADKEIRETDIERVIEAARAVAIPMDRQELHVMPRGMVGTRLEAQIHIITTPITSIQNVSKCLDRAGIDVYDIVLQNLCAAEAILADDEKEIGVLLIDIGAESTNVSLYNNSAPVFNAIYPIGGYLITNDIAAGLKLPLSVAEKFKLGFGVTSFESVEPHETVQIPSIGGRNPKIVERTMLVQIIKPRVEEIFMMIKHDLIKHGLEKNIAGGVFITGGTAKLKGIEDVAMEVFDVSASIAVPKKIDGLWDLINQPEYSVINGLIRWGYSCVMRDDGVVVKKKRKDSQGVKGGLRSFIDKFF